ncbi:hypothetical protein BGZ99_002007 [Dissophora globulifera]|uniref:Uncharacterized protein n=1 Tax=Dissophora globulifera TaxID=979702 RepID=A0A9P6RN81_9FUNG|nr:hypothetical protein BGZ99_002007 [Dissophora globulifera]
MLHITFSSSQGTLSPQQALDLATLYLENARKSKDREVVFALCDDAETALSRMKRVDKRRILTSPWGSEDQVVRNRIATAYFERGNILDSWDYFKMAQISYTKAEKWGHVKETGHLSPDSSRLI